MVKYRLQMLTGSYSDLQVNFAIATGEKLLMYQGDPTIFIRNRENTDRM